MRCCDVAIMRLFEVVMFRKLMYLRTSAAEQVRIPFWSLNYEDHLGVQYKPQSVGRKIAIHPAPFAFDCGS